MANQIMHITYSQYTYTGYIVVGADPLRQKSVTDLPRKDRRTLPLVLRDFGDHLWRGDPGFAAANRSRPYGARLIISAQDLAHAAVGYLDVKTKDTIHIHYLRLVREFLRWRQIIITFSLSSTWTSSWVYEHKKYALNSILGMSCNMLYESKQITFLFFYRPFTFPVNSVM